VCEKEGKVFAALMKARGKGPQCLLARLHAKKEGEEFDIEVLQ